MELQPFSLYCECEVVYDGRACSTLEIGNYLILSKPDDCIAVHGGCFTKPLNYQNPGSTIRFLRSGSEFDDLWTNLFSKKPSLIIRATNKREALTIAVYHVHHQTNFADWTVAKIKLVKSERDLVIQITDRINDYFPAIDIILVETETPTPYGNIDILMLDAAGTRHIVEVKRKIMSVAGCGQIARYAAHYTAIRRAAKQYLAAPAITANASAYANKHHQTWVRATFDD